MSDLSVDLLHSSAHDLAPWLGDDTAPVRAVRRALCDVFIAESPPGSNRGRRIDLYNALAGVAVGSAYCAAAVGFWWRYAGLEVPSGYVSTDNWYWWALRTRRFLPPEAASRVVPGAAILYGTGAKGNPAFHIGLVIRTTPWLCTFEANTSRAGAPRREGEAFDRKWYDQPEKIPLLLGFVSPTPLEAAHG